VQSFIAFCGIIFIRKQFTLLTLEKRTIFVRL
jgi:hypothetical protein